MKDEELEKNQQSEIGELLEGLTAPSTSESTTSGSSEASTSTEANTETSTIIEGEKDVKKGEERKEEETSRQESTTDTGKKVEGEVGAKEGEVKSVTETTTTKVKEEVKPPEKTREQLLEEDNKALRQRLEELAGKIITPTQPKPMTPEEEKRKKDEQAKQVLRFVPNDEVFDEVMKSADNFNALLTSIVNVAVERSIRIVPQIATQLIDQHFNLKTAVDTFYTENNDLKPHMKYIGFIANEISSQHPDWGLSQILQEVEKEARVKLNIPKSALSVPGSVTIKNAQTGSTNTNTANNTNPGFVPGGGGSRTGSPSSTGNLTKAEKEIVDLIS